MQNATSSVGEINTNTTNLYNDNVNNNLTNNVNDNVAKSKQVDLIADKLVTALSNPAARSYYCKLGYKLSEAQIWNNLEQSAKGKNPIKLFTWLCQIDLKRAG